MTAGPDLEGYEVRERVDATERSSTYRARRLSDGRAVIVKVSATGVSPREAFARYQHEREVVQSLAAAGAACALDVLLGADFAALVVEDIGGRPLKELVRGGPLPLAQALDVGHKLARALGAVHAAGMVHRDVNGWNVVYAPATREVQIIDFELATRWRLDAGAVVGRLPYLAPEQLGRSHRRVDSRADLYALGVTLCELLTGRLPSDTADARALVLQRLADGPIVVADIVEKLLAKDADRRYQTADAVAADLDACSHGATFAIAQNDVSSRFEFPERIYGREAEIAKLRAAFERAAQGVPGVALVSGYSGIGKTAIVRELRQPVLERGGFFACAKLDPLLGEGAQTAIATALGDLVAELLTDSDAAVATWRRRLLEAVGSDGHAIVEVIPAIARLIGPQPALDPLEPDAELARFCAALDRLVRVFARPEHPLVLFIDDLQWADGATLGFLRLLATSDRPSALLIVGAYRDNEVAGTHQLLGAVGELERRGVDVERVEMQPLLESDIGAFLADMFHQSRAEVADLTTIVVRKTHGNPFFIRQLLSALHGKSHIRFDEPARRFVFDVGAIHDSAITDNVADVLTENLERLPVTAQRILSLAAAIGTRFDLEVLAIVADMPLEQVHDELQAAVVEELVLPLSDLEYFDDEAGRPWLMCRLFGFQHDRIHEAAHGQLARSERERLHVAIGRLLLERATPAELDKHVFDIIHHLNRGIPLIGEQAERVRIADLAFRAGRRARDAGAYVVAVASFRCAARLRDWSEDYEGALQAHHGLAESLQLTQDFTGALAVIDTAAAQATSDRDRVTVEALRVSLLFHKGEIKKALECCRQAAALLGVDLPTAPDALQARIDETMTMVLAAIDRGRVESFAELAPMSDPKALALMTLAMNTLTGAFQIEPKLFRLIVATMVSLSIRFGNCAASARAYVTFAIVLHAIGREDDAIRFGKVGQEMGRRTADRPVQASVGFVYVAGTAAWIQPIDRCLEELRAAQKDGLDSGVYSHMGYSAALIANLGLWKGVPLVDLADEADRNQKLVLELGEPGNAAMLAATRTVIEAYRSADADGNDEPLACDADNLLQRAYVDLAEVERSYMLGDARRALAIADASPSASETVGYVNSAIFRFFHGLAVTAAWEPAGRAARERMLADNQTAMKRWADRCPANFSAMYLLVEAERARVAGQPTVALDLYDEAIAAASRHGMVKLTALANELAARFWLGRKKRDLAQVYARKATQLYAGWGARAKVALLAREELRRTTLA